MNSLGAHNRKRKLPILLAVVILLQTLLGIPGLAAEAGSDAAAGADAQHASLSIDTQPPFQANCGQFGSDDCAASPDAAQCDYCRCCLGTHVSLLPELVALRYRAISAWSMPPRDRFLSRSNSTIHRPPIS